MVKNLPTMQETQDTQVRWISKWGKIPWRRKWQPLQYSCLENLMDRGAWQAMVYGGLHRVGHDD